MKSQKPLLSIGMIFRNDIRCIERCLEALRPLREAVPSELIMADTGSGDGSRAVAERHADILFDFTWIDDFAAARNAVMDRASGKWFLTVDTDEYLDPDISELVRFLRNSEKSTAEMVTLTVRNYETREMDGAYKDFTAGRILRMSTGMRYEGVIHERWEPGPGHVVKLQALKKTVFHHDGYVGLHREQGKEKRERNLRLLEKKLEQDPDSLMTWLQLIESSATRPEVVDYLRRAMEMTEEKVHGWDKLGPPIFRYAVNVAKERKLPEFETWVDRARELFPKSLYIRLDVEFAFCIDCWDRKDRAGCIESGERYLAALVEYRAGRYDRIEEMYSTLLMTHPAKEVQLRLAMTAACVLEGDYERALRVLSGVDFSLFSAKQVGEIARVMMELHSKSELDTSAIVVKFWNGITDARLSQKRIDANKSSFVKSLAPAFKRDAREREPMAAEFRRHACTLAAPLENELEAGRAAVIMSTDDPRIISRKLLEVGDWNRFPIHALGYALERGAAFPPAGKSMNMEEMDALAKRLLHGDGKIILWLAGPDALAVDGGPQNLCWARALTLAAVHAFKWAGDGVDVETGLGLAQAFARVEGGFLPLCYAPGALEDAHLFLLPPMHRFGWYCARAFDALDGGDTAGYVRLLRAGLSRCESMTPMVEFLLKRTPELQAPTPSPELLALAEQIRTVLANFDPDNPAVVALKQSEAYQKVAWIIEGASVPAAGGLPQ